MVAHRLELDEVNGEDARREEGEPPLEELDAAAGRAGDRSRACRGLAVGAGVGAGPRFGLRAGLASGPSDGLRSVREFKQPLPSNATRKAMVYPARILRDCV
jgi:hypothetical protein